MDLSERLEFLDGRGDATDDGRANVDLRDLAAGERARVGEGKGEGEDSGGRDGGGGEGGEGEGRVGEPVAEGEEGRDGRLLVVTVADVDALFCERNGFFLNRWMEKRGRKTLTSPYTTFPGVSDVIPKEWNDGLSSRRTLQKDASVSDVSGGHMV